MWRFFTNVFQIDKQNGIKKGISVSYDNPEMKDAT